MGDRWNDDEVFRLYLRLTDELLDSRLVRTNDLRSSFHLGATEGGAVRFDTHAPDEENLRSFLLTFRKFISDREPVFVNSVANRLETALTGDDVRQQLRDRREGYRRSQRTGQLGLIVNGDRFPPERVLDLWINGRYFHDERRKAAALDALDPTSTLFARHQFLDALVEATRYVLFLAEVITVCHRDGLLR